MDPRDPFIQRWLNRVQSDAPFRLGDLTQAQPPAGLSAEEQSEWRRLLLVEGLLGTLDQRTAPTSLDRMVEEAAQAIEALKGSAAAAEIPDGVPEEWVGELAELDPQPWAGEAPEFLDRLVQQKFEAMEAARITALRAEEQPAKQRVRLARPLKRVSLVASGLLVLLMIPWGSWFSSNDAPQIRLTEYASFEGLRSAHPDHVRVASRSGEFGALMGGAASLMGSPSGSQTEDQGGDK